MTKVMITVDGGVAVRDIQAVSNAVWRHLSPQGVYLLSPTAQDTLDFTGPGMNTGSRLILVATPGTASPLRTSPPPQPPRPADVHPRVRTLASCGPAFLMVQVGEGDLDLQNLQAALIRHAATRQYLFQVVVSQDVPLDDPILSLWGWFTRFDPAADIHAAGQRVQGNRLLLDFPLLIDARWKKGYPKPVGFDPDVARRVDQRWRSYGIDLG